MIYVFDIDGTICNDTHGAYELCQPNWDRISKINKLYDDGNTIIYQTARGMGSSSGDQIKAHKKYYNFTYHQLMEWRCKFHGLYLGKPKADFYVDDKAISDGEFFG